MIIKKPVLTEKSLNEYKTNNKVTFSVDLLTNGAEVKNMVEKVYGVKVEKYWVKSRLGKTRKNFSTGKMVTKKNDDKIVTLKLKKGDKIDIFES